MGNTAQFPPDGLSTAPAAAAPRSSYRHLELYGIVLTTRVSLLTEVSKESAHSELIVKCLEEKSLYTRVGIEGFSYLTK